MAKPGRHASRRSPTSSPSTTSAAVPMSGTKLLAQPDERKFRAVQSVDHEALVEGPAAVDRENGDVHVAGAAHVLQVAAAETRQRDAGNEHGIGVLARPDGERRLDFAGMTVLFFVFWMSTVGASPVTVSVSATDPDRQVGIDRGGIRARQLDALPLDDVETRSG